jgi:signal transduction histidine kinase
MAAPLPDLVEPDQNLRPWHRATALRSAPRVRREARIWLERCRGGQRAWWECVDAPVRRRFHPGNRLYDALLLTVPALLAALGASILSALLAAAIPGLPVAQIGVVLVAVVAVAAYLGGWVVGGAALAAGTLALDLSVVGGRGLVDLPWPMAQAMGLTTTVGAGVAVIWLGERVRRQGGQDRIDATAARVAASALMNIETAATTVASGDPADRDRLLDALLTAMVRVNRAHAGALFLAGPDGRLVRTAAYGVDHAADDHPTAITPGEGVLGLVAQERRTRFVADLRADPQLAAGHLAAAGIRSILATPIIASDGRLLGVAHIALLVPHRFTPAEAARVEALAGRAASLLETGLAASRRHLLLTQTRADLRRLQMVITAMPEAVVLAAPDDGRIIASNAAAEALFGDFTDGDPGHPALDGLRWPDGAPADPDDLPMGRALADGEIATGVELVARGAGGRDVPLLASAAPIREPNGVISAVVGVFQDIGPFKDATRLQDEFVSVVSHDLRAPLTPIRGFVQLVARDLAREGGHDVHVDRLRSLDAQIDRMTRLVDDLLDVSRLRAGRLQIERCPTDLLALCRAALDARRPNAPDHDLVLDASLDELPGNLDPDRVLQVVDNLVSNAIKYSPDGGTVTVALAADRDRQCATLSVADDGPGIPVTSREQVFGAFYRTAEAAASRTAGLGLGLFICHELVTAHGGTIEVGTAPSGGALFTVHLPLDRPATRGTATSC